MYTLKNEDTDSFYPGFRSSKPSGTKDPNPTWQTIPPQDLVWQQQWLTFTELLMPRGKAADEAKQRLRLRYSAGSRNHEGE